MGVIISYTTIPPQTSLYQRLQQEEPLFIVAYHMGLSSLFGSFYFDDDPLTELVREYPNIFKSEMAVDKAIAELRSETVATLQAYPNTGKQVFLQKNFDRIEEYLRQALKIPKNKKTAKVILEIMYGGQAFTPPSLIKSKQVNPWELIPHHIV
jgi:hypothetical protein